MGAPENLEVDMFLGPISHFGPLVAIVDSAGVSGSERVPPADINHRDCPDVVHFKCRDCPYVKTLPFL